MTVKLIVNATQADADLCNALEPPSSGCNAGGGVHIVIPPDFAARIAAGQDVPGCTYARLEPQVDDTGKVVGTALAVSDIVQAKAVDANVTKKLTAQQQADAAALATKLAAVPVDPGAAAITADTQVSVKGK